jgi:hypothetical protein
VLGTLKQDRGAEFYRTILLQMAEHTAREKQQADLYPERSPYLSSLVK